MRIYNIEISEDASNDMDELADIITYEYCAPKTAFDYIQGILNTINRLRQFPYAYSVRRNISLLRFGHYVRRVNYKKVAIIYTVHEDVVHIHRIISSASVTGL